MLGVVVRLIPSEEQQIRIQLLEIVDDLGARPWTASAVARQIANDNFVLFDWILANQAFETRAFTMPNTVRTLDFVVPIFNTKMRTPTQLIHGLSINFFPSTVWLFEFQSHRCFFVRLQGEQLS